MYSFNDEWIYLLKFYECMYELFDEFGWCVDVGEVVCMMLEFLDDVVVCWIVIVNYIE